jgi:hypothetical protein
MEDIWSNIKKDFLGLGKNPKQYFTKWCPTTPSAQAIRNSEEFAEYQLYNYLRCTEQIKQGIPQHTPTWAHWRKEMLTIWPGRGDRPDAYSIISSVCKKFDLPMNKKIGRIHIWKLYHDLSGLYGERLQDKAQWKIQVDGKEIWDMNFSQPWFEIAKSLHYSIEEDNCGPNYDTIGRAKNRERLYRYPDY